MPDGPQTVDTAAFDAFRSQLLDAGYSSEDGGRTWRGPLPACLHELTAERSMRIKVPDGWPYVQPSFYVQGLPVLEHADAHGSICLWPHGDGARQWTRWEAIEDRLQEWARRQEEGFDWADATMDAHAYFDGHLLALASMDLAELGAEVADGARGSLHGRWRHGERLLELSTQKAGGTPVKGSWFFVRTIAAPPRTLDELAALLTSDAQRSSLAELRRTVREDSKGARRVVLLAWDSSAGRNALVVLLDRDPDSVAVRRARSGAPERDGLQARARALEFAPTAPDVLRLRAGEQAQRLGDRSAVIYGLGAIGSHVADGLARAGIRTLELVDAEVLRPGNVVRHLCGHEDVGRLKVDAVRDRLAACAPWAQVTATVQGTWAPETLRAQAAGHDLVIDATGEAGFGDQLSRLLGLQDEMLITAALYRKGAVARVCRQGPGDTPLGARDDPARYPEIPKGPEGEPVALEPGCSAPVNLAPAASVMTAASLAVRMALDALDGPFGPDEVTEVLCALERAPLDQVGRLASG